jgi:bifunctional NMN adenylyltransferase/nudix hydrolase
MEQVQPTNAIGVIIGRFQVPDLHEGHRELIQGVKDKHPTTVVLLGMAPLPNTINNPLGFEARQQMITALFPNVTVLPVLDHSNDGVWSQNVDAMIRTVVGPQQTAVLYGSRDSFIQYYSGIYSTIELEPEFKVSGTEIREKVQNECINTRDFRAGLIAASTMRFPTAYQAVDVAIFNEGFSHILLGRKPGQEKFQLLGGFSDPELSESLEDDAEREALEESGLEVTVVDYLCSQRIDDWRYRKEPDCVRTVLFAAICYESSEAHRKEGFFNRTDKELVETKWFNLSSDIPLREMHLPLLKKAIDYAKDKRND